MSVSRAGFLSVLAAAAGMGVATRAEAAKPPWDPLPPPLKPPKQRVGRRALVLSGGGARGSYEAGVLKYLFKDADEEGPPFDLVCGTSAGAINAAFAARGTQASIAQAETFWRDLPNEKIMVFEPQFQQGITAVDYILQSSHHGYPAKLSYLARANRSFHAMGPPKELVYVMGAVNDDAIQKLVRKYAMTLDELKLSLVITATNVTVLGSDTFYNFNGPFGPAMQQSFLTAARLLAANQIIEDADVETPRDSYDHRYRLSSDNFMDAVLASTAVPGVFQPVSVVHDETGAVNDYVDGGVANNVPVGVAVNAGATDVTVVMVNAPDEIVPPPPETLPDLLQACFNLMQRQILESDVRLVFTRNLLSRHREVEGLSPDAADFVNALHLEHWEPIRMRVIRPAQTLDVTTMGFDNADGIAAAIDAGYQDAQNPLLFSA